MKTRGYASPDRSQPDNAGTAGDGARIYISVVSHAQDELVVQLLDSIAEFCNPERLAVTVTQNINNSPARSFNRFPFPVTTLQNSRPKGFGANHNQAFSRCREEFFCVLNPDILLVTDVFGHLISLLSVDNVGVAAPILVDSSGRLQDSAREFPSPGRIISRVFRRRKRECGYPLSENCISPDWVAGMFMFFPSRVYQKIGGFDESYFMYCEDVDICKRLKNNGYTVLVDTRVSAVHNPRRNSHRSPMYLWWHLASLLRFFLRYPFYTL